MQLLLALILAFGLITSAAAENKTVTPENLHIYLLLGQSNMVGRGAIGETDKKSNPRVFMLTQSNEWQLAREPLHVGRNNGVGPGFTFGKMMAKKNPRAKIGLVPCAVGGTLLSRWSKGGDLYSNAVARAKIAMQHGTLKGIVWHQGENDSILEENAKTYEERLIKMIGDIRADLNAPELPFVVGQIGEFLYTRKDPTKTPYAKIINDALAEIPNKVANTACVKSKGLTHKGDEVHFDTDSQHELGKRFAVEMLKLQSRATAVTPRFKTLD
jgi:hypothetical protein